MLKRYRPFGFILLALFCFFGLGADFLGSTKVERSAPFLGSKLEITVFDSTAPDNAAAIVEKALRMASELEGKISAASETSIIARVNKAGVGEALDLDEATFYIIKTGLYVAEASDGAFDITDGALKKVWALAKEKLVPPAESEIKSALFLTDHRALELNTLDRKLVVRKTGITLDLGAVAKGYALDRIADFLKDNDIHSAIVTCGSLTRLVGQFEGARAWRFGIEHPRKLDLYAIRLEIEEEKGLSSTTDFDKFFMFEGKRYPDTINPKTGYPEANKVASVTVIGNNTALAGALSAAFFVMGSEAGFEMIERMTDEHVEAVCIEESPKNRFILTTSEGAQNYIRDIQL